MTRIIGFAGGAFVNVDQGGADTTPDAFSFTDQTDVALSQTITSAEITVAGIDAAANISVAGGEYSINGGGFTSSPGTVNNGDAIRARHTSSSSYSTAVDTIVTIGGVSDTFTSTTEAEPTITVPDVVGQSEASAIAELEGAGFEVVLDSANDEVVAEGDVISQSPIAGAEAPAGSIVTIVISLGPAPVFSSSSGRSRDARRAPGRGYLKLGGRG